MVNDARSPVSPRSGQLYSSSPATSATGTLPPSKVIIGGVRRWMSINKPGGSPRLGGLGQRRSSKRYSTISSEGGDLNNGDPRRVDGVAPNRSTGVPGSGSSLPSARATGGFDLQTFNFAGRWQTVNPVGKAAVGSNVPIEAALNRACNPQISEEEESEYAFYTTQFLDEYAQPNEGENNDAARSSTEATGVAGRSKPVSAALTDHHLIDEKDIQTYEEGVAISEGKPTAVDRFVRYSTIDPVLVSHADAVNLLAFPAGAASSYHPIPMTAGSVAAPNGSSTAMMTGSGAPGLTASEAKIRAYSSWLSLGQTKLASF